MSISKCLKCGNKKPMVTSQSLPGEGLYLFVRCTCGNTGPKTRPSQTPMEHMDYAEARAVRLWNRENIPESGGHLPDGDARGDARGDIEVLDEVGGNVR